MNNFIVTWETWDAVKLNKVFRERHFETKNERDKFADAIESGDRAFNINRHSINQ